MKLIWARLVFANTIDYANVYIHNDEFLPFGLQNDNTVMTPNGEIYFPKGLYRDDFSNLASQYASLRHLFIHEMVHVWQHQLGYSVMIKGLYYIHGVSLLDAIHIIMC